MSVKILIDSGSDITEREATYLGVNLIPIEVSFGDEEYLDGVNLTAENFYDKLTTSKSLPKTSQINPYRFHEEFTKALFDNSEIVVITLSSKISGTYNSALEAAKSFNDKVYVVDSLNACTGQKLLCLYALNLVKQGLSAKQIKEELDKVKLNIKLFAVIDTLEYLKKGGRISSASATIGTMLSIKPIISVTDGEVKVVGKAIGQKKSYSMLTSFIEKNGEIDNSKPAGFIYSGTNTLSLEAYKSTIPQIIRQFHNIEDHPLGCTIGTHIGPGAVGIAYFKK